MELSSSDAPQPRGHGRRAYLSLARTRFPSRLLSSVHPGRMPSWVSPKLASFPAQADLVRRPPHTGAAAAAAAAVTHQGRAARLFLATQGKGAGLSIIT